MVIFNQIISSYSFIAGAIVAKHYSMKKLIIFLFSFPSTAFCLLDNNIPPAELPPQVCQILYLDKDAHLQGSCSGTLIRSNFILSAKHCEYLIRNENTKSVLAKCPNTKKNLITRSISLEAEQEERSQSYKDDLVIHQLAVPLSANPAFIFPLPKYEEMEKNLNFECQVFGYGSEELKGFRFSYKEVAAEAFTNPQFALNIPDGIVEEGDSGGAYFCREEKGPWMLVGVINQIIRGHALAESLYRHLDWIKETTSQ